jgi:anti-sigma regulatory factor (Ser/Thr protein kinase)
MDTAFSLYSFKENPFDIVWKFTTADEVNALVTNFISFIRETDQIEKGVLNSIEIGINEIMDNVLQHSQAPGFIMGHLQKDEKKLSITIFDCGIGIYNSLKGSKHNPSSPLDAITLAMQERVTRDEKIGQGNGMWIMSSLVNENKGSIRISSCGAAYSSVKNEVNTSKEGDFYFDGKHGTTAVEFELDYSKPIDVTKALKGYTPTDLWLENRELDNGDYKIIVADEAEGTGTRKSAYKMKNKILNIYKETGKKIILDFSGVNVMSFSFADELLGKIISEYGFVFFTETFKLVNLSDINIQILNRSVEQRMAQNYYAEPVDCNE